MNTNAEMTDAEIVQHLKFTEPWYRLGIIDAATMRDTILNFRMYDDSGDEHWRYGAFVHFMRRHAKLTEEQCAALFELGACDPDSAMGQSIMLEVLDRRE